MSTTTAPATQRWRIHAACRGTGPALFYDPHPASVAAATTVCDSCPVQAECRAHALAAAEPFGVWGGLTESERAEILSRVHYIGPGADHHDRRP